ncbi:retrovirus-related Pol polyprotein from transposon 17.6 [Trichonephila clavipes]|nr:retrovirus-related Pol polyprotein from transposon 17.6 [Trichonephila clavipes]
MYDGGESLGIRRFLEKINDVANLGKWSNDEKVTILKLKLTGIAEEFFLSDPTHSQLIEYNDIARILIGRFEKAVPLSTRLQLFSSCIQGPSESVQEFAARINKLGTQIFQSGNSAQNTAVRNANDQLLQSRFISGLRNDIRRFVLSRDPLNLEESINAALIEEQNMKLNQIASEERSGLSSAQTENPVLSALADRLQEINLRVGRLQEASAVTARKSGGNYFNRRENVLKCFYCRIQGHRQAECRKRQRDERAARYQPPEKRRKRVFFQIAPGRREKCTFRGICLPRQLRSPQAFGLDSKIKNRLFQLLISHKSAFARSTVELSAAATEHHRISLQHDYPIKCPIYKIPFNLRNEFRRQIADLEKAGIISKSNSQYNTPALFVKQKEKWRLVLDFRKLNEITVTQDFVIPTLDDILHEISGSNYFSALDMKSAFNQIPLHFADRHKTAFSTPDGDKYQFNRLCFGLKNSPKAFQSIAQEVLGDLLHHGALVYIDDIILFTKTIDEHFELLGRKFKVFTDHKPLAGFLSNKNPSSKILRWKLALEEFNYDIHYIRGSLNSVADHLSRYINNITIALPDSKDLINMQREDSVLSTIIQKIDQNDVSPQISNYFINGEGLLCHLSKRPSRSPRSNTTRKQVCIPHCLKAKILESVHSEYGGHLKFFKTYHRLSENFFWHNMYKDTKNFVRSCTICLSRKNAFKIPPAPHQLVEQSTEPGETCHMDIFGPLKTTLKGNSYVLSMIDAFTKYIHIVPLPDIRSSTISKAFFDNYIVHRGCPHKLVVDNATYFKSSEFVEFCRVMGIQKRHISSYSAHVNGRVEKPNQSLANILASISQNTNDWDEQLPHTMLALNSAIHEATYTSPFFLEHGRDIRLSYTYEKNSDTPQNKYEYVEKLLPSLEHTFNKVLNNLKDQEASHVELSTRATKQHHYDYKIGSLCFIKTPNIKSNLSPKLRPKFEGPYRVIERFSNVNYRVQHVEQLRKRFNTHVNRMIPFIKRFSYLHLKNLGDLQPDETEVKGIVPGPRYNLRARAGANAELKRLYKLVINPELAGFLVDENINWKFLPPRAPNFGGLWEAGIKSFKFHFKREAGNSRFTYEEFLTIMTQIEGILNSRPLTPCQRI